MCKLQDDAYYPILFYCRETEEMRRPVCLSEKTWIEIKNTSGNIICPMYLCLCVIFTTLFFDGFGLDFLILSETESWCVLLTCLLLLFFGPVEVIRLLRRRAYKKAQSSEENPKGYTYQGRILEKDNPHYLKHLAQYEKYKSWTLPETLAEEK